jgi:DeoR/GlpR family transcriptional regulator of sugar metabolism
VTGKGGKVDGFPSSAKSVLYLQQVTTHDLGDAAVKQFLIGCARRTVLVLDGSKFTHSAMAAVCDATSLDVVVTDDTAPAEAIASLEAAGTVVHRV